MTPTMTSAVKDLQQPGETSTQAIHRLKTPQETMSECQHRLVKEAASSSPEAPSGIATPTSAGVTATGFTANWTAPANGDPVTSYQLTVKTGGSNAGGSPFTLDGSTLTKVVGSLTAGTDYDVVVKATNGAGSATSPTLTVTTTATVTTATNQPNFDAMTKDELIAYAKTNNITIDKTALKADILKVIKAA